MNKSISILLAALLLASCTQDELPQDTPGSGFSGVITFNSPYTATRSDALRSGDFVAGDQVGVLGFCKASNTVDEVTTDYSTSPWDTKKMFAKPDVFYNQMLEYQGDGSWTYKWSGTFDNQGPVGGDSEGGLHPWSTNPDDTFSFFAYYPYASGDPNGQDERKITIDGVEMGTIKLSGADDTGDPTITYTMPHADGGTPTSTRDWWRVPDFMLAYKTDHLKSNGSVKLNFRHLFSALRFEINNYNEWDVTINELKFGAGEETENNIKTDGFYRSVTVVGQESGYSVNPQDSYMGEFQLIGEEDKYMLDRLVCSAAENNEPSRTTIEYEGEPITLFFIPDEDGHLTFDNNRTLHINVSMTSDGVDYRDGDFSLPSSTFQAGVCSIFTINIIGNDIYLRVRSDGKWENEGDSDITFE